ncbi:Ribokinase [Propionicimonas sp. T2.31MG-18]|uniref:carbohydrate kinase family protein n=1 Tax=Propionicimonas sp. T2.31MG-18 TaxID=3157620 RepID=UPI0035E96B02
MATGMAAVIGETLMDVIRRPGEPASEHPGGSPLNVAVGLGRLGHPSMLVTWMAEDDHGQVIKQHLDESGVTLAPGATQAERTSTANIVMHEDGKLDYSFDLLWALPPMPEDFQPLVVHAASLGAIHQPGADDVFALISRSREHATITYDPNIRPDIMKSPERVRPLVERLVNAADVTKVSAEDLEWLYPDRNPESVAAEWANGGSLVVLTKGERGSATFRMVDGARRCLRVLPGYCSSFVDAVGAGDSFMSGLIHALWEHGLLGADKRPQLAAIDDETLLDSLCMASTIAAITVSRLGADPPWLCDLGDHRAVAGLDPESVPAIQIPPDLFSVGSRANAGSV